MTNIHEHFSRLGLSQYVPIFMEEGFDRWETVLHITESDLDLLGVKLGHRRILQREIASTRGATVEHLSLPSRTQPIEEGRPQGSYDLEKPDGSGDGAHRGKRKYRRHPKVDDNAPERHPSAYVLFSNKVREELKPQNLSFTEIAKLVGERWQLLAPDEKAPYEQEALSMKETYHTEMSLYKLTEEYRAYQEYLADFKAKNSGSIDGKRPKLEQDISAASTASCHENSDAASDSTRDPGYRRKADPPSVLSSAIVAPFASPLMLSSRPYAVRGDAVLKRPPSSISPVSTSPSSPSIPRDSLIGITPTGTLQSRPFSEMYTHNPTSYAKLSQRLQNTAPYESLDAPSTRSSSSGPIDQIITRHQRGDSVGERLQAPTAELFHQKSSSSQMSSNSTFSSASTAPSSIFPPRPGEEESGKWPQLPPIAAIAMTPGGGMNLTDYAMRRGPGPNSSEGPAGPHSQPTQPTPISISSTTSSRAPRVSTSSSLPSGMPFESLQLPLPYNVSFGQAAPPRSARKGTLADISNLQVALASHTPPRHSLRNLSLQQHSSKQQQQQQQSQHTDQSSMPPSPLQHVLPSLRSIAPGFEDHCPEQSSPPPSHDDRLALLADAAHAKRGPPPRP